MKAAVYFGSRHIYDDMVSAYKSLLVNSDVQKIYLLIEDDEFPYKVHRDVEVINISKLIEKWFVPGGANWSSGWTYIGLIRGALAKVFPELDKILSIDCDTLVQSDVSDLWDIPIDDYYVAGVMEPALSRYSNGLYINAGVTMWNLKKLREDGKDDEMIEDLNRNKRMFVSQDTLNAVCRDHILKINAAYNACAYTEQASETKIVHFAGGLPGNWRDLETVKYYRNLPIEEIRPEKKNRMNTLDIIVPHYKEPWEFCKYLFDTIAIQRGMLFDNVRVIMVNDGKQVDSNLTAKDLSAIERDYPFQTDVYFKPHEGVSAARNYGLRQSDADYVMFCDADDGFLNSYSLHLVFAAMQEGFDYTHAAEYAKEALRRDPGLSEVHGELKLSMGGWCKDWAYNNHNALIDFYKDYLEIHSDCKNAYLHLLDNLLDDFRLTEAGVYLDRYAALDHSYRIPMYRGLIEWFAGNRDGAFRIWEQMEQEHPENWCVYQNIGDFLVRSQRYDEAIGYYRKALIVMAPPRWCDPIESIAQVCELMGDIPAAIAAWQEELHLFESEWDFTTGETADVVHRNIARLEEKLRK